MDVAIFGHTGLVGSKTIELLDQAEWCTRIHAIGRKPPKQASKKMCFHSTTFNDKSSIWPAHIKSTVGIWCLGSTQKKAGSKKQFQTIDFEWGQNVATLARLSGVQHWILVSAAGADSESLFFYNRVKGDLEKACLELEFPKITILRPGLILGKREESRIVEGQLQKILKPLASSKKQWFDHVKPVDADDIAHAILQCAHEQSAPQLVLNSGTISRIANHLESL